MVCIGPLTSCEKQTSPISLERLMSDLSLFEELPLERLYEEVVYSLSIVYREAIKGVQDLLMDATPFKMATAVSVFLILYILGILLQLTYLVVVTDEFF